MCRINPYDGSAEADAHEFRVLGFRVQGLGFRVQGFRYRVQGLGFGI